MKSRLCEVYQYRRIAFTYAFATKPTIKESYHFQGTHELSEGQIVLMRLKGHKIVEID